MTGKLILTTERLLLREFTEDDAEAFYPLGSDPDVTRFVGGTLRDVAHAREVLRTHPLADYQRYGFGRWACVLQESQQLIGLAGLKYLPEWNEVDVGYCLLPSCWGRGVATEAARAVIEYGFGKLRLTRILAVVAPENVASVRVLEKCGLQRMGLVDFRGDWVARYEITAPQSQEVNAS